MTEGETPQCDGLALVRFKEREDAAKALKAIAEVKVRQGLGRGEKELGRTQEATRRVRCKSHTEAFPMNFFSWVFVFGVTMPV